MYVLFLITSIVKLILGHLDINFTNIFVIVLLVLLTIVGIAGLMIIVHCNSGEEKKVIILSKKNLTDQHFLNYFSLVVLLAVSFDLTKLSLVLVFLTIMIFVGIVYIKNNIFYINPLLNILGYSFYDITYDEEDGKKKELRIFFKGSLKVKGKYTLSACNKNINFLK